MEQYRIHNFRGNEYELLVRQREVETSLAELYENRSEENIAILESYIRSILNISASRDIKQGDIADYVAQCRVIESARENRERRRVRLLSSERQTLRERNGHHDYVKNELSDSLPISSNFQSMSSAEIDSEFTMNKLRQYCRESGMKGYGRFTKSELIQQLRD